MSEPNNPTDETQQLRLRVSELESRYSFLDDLLNTLNGVIAQQDQRIADMQRELDTAVRQLRQLDTSARASNPADNEPPPHF